MKTYRNIYRELSLYNVDNVKDLKQYYFDGVELGMNGFVVSPALIGLIKDTLPEGTILSCPIDYPYGQGHHKVRNHAIIRAIRSGANAIDLPVNRHLIEQGKISDLACDLLSSFKICGDYGITLRIVLEYRHTDNQTMCHILDTIKDIGIEYVVSRSDLFVDDITDNILFCWDVQSKYGINTIVNGNVSKKDYQTIEGIGELFGIRLQNLVGATASGV